MKNLKIRVYKHDEPDPETTVTIPGGVMNLAAKLIPTRAKEALLDEGIDVAELARLAEQPDVQGTLVEIEEHAKRERVVVALE